MKNPDIIPKRGFQQKTEKKFNSLINLKNSIVLGAGLVVASASFGQEKKNDGSKIDTISNNKTKPDTIFTDKSYTTLEGNYRYYHEPKGEKNVLYSLGSTRSPFQTEEEIRLKTKVPESLTETDFFTNYVNNAFPSDTALVDKNTGNKYVNFKKYNPNLDEISFEGDKHWNIKRFFIVPHFVQFPELKDMQESKMNALYDIFKYFLYKEKGDRDKAWQESKDFFAKEIDPVVSGKFAKWWGDNLSRLGIVRSHKSFPLYEYIVNDFYTRQGTTNFPSEALNYNGKVFQGKIKGKPYSQKEIEEVLTNYNIEFRKKDPETARKIAVQSVLDEMNSRKKEIDFFLKKPVTSYKVIREGDYPPGFYSWDGELRADWEKSNPDKVKIVQESFTEEDRKRILNVLFSYRFAK
jgi:hypothetical protein